MFKHEVGMWGITPEQKHYRERRTSIYSVIRDSATTESKREAIQLKKTLTARKKNLALEDCHVRSLYINSSSGGSGTTAAHHCSRNGTKVVVRSSRHQRTA